MEDSNFQNKKILHRVALKDSNFQNKKIFLHRVALKDSNFQNKKILHRVALKDSNFSKQSKNKMAEMKKGFVHRVKVMKGKEINLKSTLEKIRERYDCPHVRCDEAFKAFLVEAEVENYDRPNFYDELDILNETSEINEYTRILAEYGFENAKDFVQMHSEDFYDHFMDNIENDAHVAAEQLEFLQGEDYEDMVGFKNYDTAFLSMLVSTLEEVRDKLEETESEEEKRAPKRKK